ncbi:MAG: type I secretion protein, partial [Cyanobacteria bacterium J06631_9]
MGKAVKSVKRKVKKTVAKANPFYKNGGSGNDTYAIYGAGSAYGNGGHDTLKAYALYVKLSGGSGNDKLYAYSGKSKLYGGSGTDVLKGGNGSDT